MRHRGNWILVSALLGGATACDRRATAVEVTVDVAPTSPAQTAAATVTDSATASPTAAATASAAPMPTSASDRSVSPGGKHAVWIKTVGKEMIANAPGGPMEVEDTRVIRLDLATGVEEEIARNDAKEGCIALSSARYAQDDAVLVVSNGYAPTVHNLAVCAVDVTHRKIHLLARGTRCGLPIMAGRYKGDIFVSGLGFVPGQGTYDLFSVVTPVGVTVKRFTKSPFALDSDRDGILSQEELHPECEDPWPLSALEPVMRGL